MYTAALQALTAAGLMVIPELVYVLYEGWCCSEQDGNGLWSNGNWPASRFSSDWLKVATSFADNPLVIGYDLKNEPRKATIGGTVYSPWCGRREPGHRLLPALSSTATAIQAVDADALFFCEGLSYAADLTGTRTKLVTPAKGNCVVYSMHDYSWYHPSGQSQADYITAMDNAGGFLLTGGTAPVWIGEFGTGNDSLAAVGAATAIGASSPSDGNLGAWFRNFLAWACQTDVDWCWWLLDGTMCQGTTPQVNQLQFALGDRAVARPQAVDLQGQVGILLQIVHPGGRGGVHHHFRPVPGQLLPDRPGIGDVHMFQIDAHRLPVPGGRLPEQCLSQLAGRARQSIIS